MIQVYTLVGRTDYQGDDLIAVFASLADLHAHVRAHQGADGSWCAATLGYDSLYYYVSQLGQAVDWSDSILVVL